MKCDCRRSPIILRRVCTFCIRTTAFSFNWITLSMSVGILLYLILKYSVLLLAMVTCLFLSTTIRGCEAYFWRWSRRLAAASTAVQWRQAKSRKMLLLPTRGLHWQFYSWSGECMLFLFPPGAENEQTIYQRTGTGNLSTSLPSIHCMPRHTSHHMARWRRALAAT